MNEELINKYSKLIYKVASNFYGVDKNDLYQAGVLGLIKAFQNYDQSKNTKLSSYAFKYIYSEMYILACNKNIKYNKELLKLYKQIENTRYKLAQTLNKIPSNVELANYLEIDINLINLAIDSSKEVLSLDYSIDEDNNAYNYVMAKEEDLDNKLLIEDGLSILSEQEKDIIKSRYYEDLTQDEVARKLKISQVKVSRYEKKSINKLKEYLTV